MDLQAIDALVAEKVLGWTWMRYDTWRGECKLLWPVEEWPPPSGDDFGRLEGDARRLLSYDMPQYTEDIAAAWRMEGEMERRGLMEGYVDALAEIVAPDAAHVYYSAIEVYTSREWDGHKWAWAMVHASPLQRCLAALKVVGVEVEAEEEAGEDK
jgi:hypothetical protein